MSHDLKVPELQAAIRRLKVAMEEGFTFAVLTKLQSELLIACGESQVQTAALVVDCLREMRGSGGWQGK